LATTDWGGRPASPPAHQQGHHAHIHSESLLVLLWDSNLQVGGCHKGRGSRQKRRWTCKLISFVATESDACIFLSFPFLSFPFLSFPLGCQPTQPALWTRDEMNGLAAHTAAICSHPHHQPAAVAIPVPTLLRSQLVRE
jgi:hypothetical protein